MTYTKRITTAIATGAVLVNALAPVAFAQSITVDGNGAFSDNAVNVSTNSTTAVNQSNNANVVNKVNSNASSGGNSTNFNTGGDNMVKTGAATSSTEVKNMLNGNVATMPSCGGCSIGATNVTVQGNGAYSDNGVGVNNNKSVTLNQNNSANVKNDVDAKANTGKNDAKFNTGGDTSIMTKAAGTGVTVENAANFNFASVDCDCVLSGLGVTIEGNGAKSLSEVNSAMDHALVNAQDNAAHLWNDVDGNATSGSNESEYATAGDNHVVAGESLSATEVHNSGNANFFQNGSSLHLPGNWEMDMDLDFSSLWLSLNHWLVA